MALDIIGPGFGRTATNSMRLALDRLGFGPCHHMFEVRDNPHLLTGWEAATRGDKVDWDEMFAGYRSQVDWPGARFWRELAAHYPKARVVLTVRDPDEWFDSVHATIVPFLAGRGTHPNAHVNAISEMGQRLVAEQVFDGRIGERAHATKVFRDHISAVKAEIAPERLLVFDPAEGWKPLCAFLGVAEPDEPFPRTNSSKAFINQEWKR